MNNYLIFKSSDIRYAVSLQSVKSIFLLPQLSSPPEGAPGYIVGLVNFHSQIIPTLDLSKRFRHKDTPYSINHVIVILEHNNQSIGVIIESVDTIIEIPESAVLKPIKFDDKTNDVSQDISGEIKVGDEVLMLLNTESLVHSAVQLDSTEDTNPQSSGFNHFSKAEKEVLTSLTRSPNRN